MSAVVELADLGRGIFEVTELPVPFNRFDSAVINLSGEGNGSIGIYFRTLRVPRVAISFCLTPFDFGVAQTDVEHPENSRQDRHPYCDYLNGAMGSAVGRTQVVLEQVTVSAPCHYKFTQLPGRFDTFSAHLEVTVCLGKPAIIFSLLGNFAGISFTMTPDRCELQETTNMLLDTETTGIAYCDALKTLLTAQREGSQ